LGCIKPSCRFAARTSRKGKHVINNDPDSLRRRAIETRRRARQALSADLRRQLLEIAETYEDLADAMAGVLAHRTPELASEA
jgi:hypothetical protein